MTHHTEAERATFSVSVLYDAANYTDVVAESPEAAAIAAEEKFGIVSLCHQCTDDIGLGDIVGAHVYKDGQLVLDTTSEGRITQELADANARIAELTLELQAARRAPAAPVPQRRPTLDEVEQALGYHCSAWDCVDPTDLVDAILNLAAAPQPPEAESKVSQGHFDAAQVQMPEPAGCVVYANGESHYWDANRECAELFASSERSRGAPYAFTFENLYTEQQVRQLLADNGIGKDKA